MTDNKKSKKRDEVHEMARQKFLDIESRPRLHVLLYSLAKNWVNRISTFA